MSKMNYSKTEESFDEGMRRFEVNKLFEITDQLEGSKSNKHNKMLLKKLEHQLKSIERQQLKLHKSIDFKSNLQEIKRLQQLETLQSTDLDKAIDLKDKIDVMLNEVKSQLSPLDEKAIEQQRVQQINKRFNIQGHWLPL